MKITGGCYCGAIRYEFNGDITRSVQCHCRECQYITGGNPNVSVVVPESGFRYTSDAPASFTRKDLERPVTRQFCPQCGTAIGTLSPNVPGSMIIKVGTLDDPGFFKPDVAIFTIDAQSFHHVPEDLPSFPRRPG